jgi:hypothetical protein
VSGRPSYTDPRTQMRVRLQGFETITSAAGKVQLRPHRAWLAVHVELTNANYKSGPYNDTSFQAVQRPALTRAQPVRIEGRLALRSGRLEPGGTVSRWIGFDIPAKAGTYTITWNDNKRLTPPVPLETIHIRPR